MHNRILIDTGPIYALFHSGDNEHKNMKKFLSERKYRFISTLAVFTEVSYFLSDNIEAQMSFYEWVISHGIIISDINQHDILRITELTRKYSDLPMDFTDATLVVTAEKTGIREIISLDKDFDIYRLSNNEKMKNVYRK